MKRGRFYFISVLKRIINLGRIEYRILFVWWKLNESNFEYYSLIKKIFEYYSNTLKYSNIRIYSNKFAQNPQFSGSLKTLQNLQTYFNWKQFCTYWLSSIRTMKLENIVQILSLFLKKSSIFPSNNFWIFGPKYLNIWM